MAPPPPSTPTPHRFLVPKRTGTQQSGTPKPLASGSQQFHATPRFSLHSMPRGNVASSSTTPAPPPSSTFVAQRQQRSIDDSIHDIIDSSPIEQPPPRPSYGGDARRDLHDSIEVDSEPPSSAFSVLVPSSQHQQQDNNVAADGVVDVTYYHEEEEDELINEASDDGPSAKRRRLSVSSDVDMEPPITAASSQDILAKVGLQYASGGENPLKGGSNGDDDGEEEDDEMMSHDDDDDDDDNSSASPPNRRGTMFTQKQQQQQQRPKFQPVPRFKAPEPPEPGHREPLPEAFSPRRRGEKYVTGGLAAELRDWLMNIETATGNKRDGDWAAQLLVEDVQTGSNNMKLVRGSQQRQGQDTDDGGGGGGSGGLFISKSGDVSSRVILAGEGRLQGLAKKSEVAVGCLVGVARPVWEVDLGREGQWVVACDWVVLSKPI